MSKQYKQTRSYRYSNSIVVIRWERVRGRLKRVKGVKYKINKYENLGGSNISNRKGTYVFH